MFKTTFMALLFLTQVFSPVIAGEGDTIGNRKEYFELWLQGGAAQFIEETLEEDPELIQQTKCVFLLIKNGDYNREKRILALEILKKYGAGFNDILRKEELNFYDFYPRLCDMTPLAYCTFHAHKLNYLVPHLVDLGSDIHHSSVGEVIQYYEKTKSEDIDDAFFPIRSTLNFLREKRGEELIPVSYTLNFLKFSGEEQLILGMDYRTHSYCWEKKALTIWVKGHPQGFVFSETGSQKLIFSVLIGELSPHSLLSFTNKYFRGLRYISNNCQIPKTPFDFLFDLNDLKTQKLIDRNLENWVAEKIDYHEGDGLKYLKFIEEKFSMEEKEGKMTSCSNFIFFVEKNNLDYSLSLKESRMERESNEAYGEVLPFLTRQKEEKANKIGDVSYANGILYFDIIYRNHHKNEDQRNQIKYKCIANGIALQIVKNIFLGKKTYKYYFDILADAFPVIDLSREKEPMDLHSFLQGSYGLVDFLSEEEKCLVSDNISKKLSLI